MDETSITDKLIPFLSGNPYIGTTIVVNGQIGCCLLGNKFNAVFVYAKPKIDEGSVSKHPYLLGHLNGIKVMLDPNRQWNDYVVTDETGKNLIDLSK